jgi:hypothetical protein
MLYRIEEVNWVNRRIKLRGANENVIKIIRYDGELNRLIGEENGVEYKVMINPTYKESRDFIAKYLCPPFDEHKKKLSWKSPHEYFMIFRHDLRVFSNLLKLNNIRLNLGEIAYTIGGDFVEV